MRFRNGAYISNSKLETLISNISSYQFMEYFFEKNIAFIGHEADYLNLAVRDGGVSLTMGLGNGKQEMHIKPAKTRFDDHQWHKLTVHRRIQEVRMIV